MPQTCISVVGPGWVWSRSVGSSVEAESCPAAGVCSSEAACSGAYDQTFLRFARLALASFAYVVQDRGYPQGC